MDLEWLGMKMGTDFRTFIDLRDIWRTWSTKYHSYTHYSLTHQAKYIFSSLLISYILSTFFPKEIKPFILFSFLALMLTPENFGIGSRNLSPVIFSFTFDLIFEQSLSAKTLRPLVFSLPLAFTLSLLFLSFKKRFSRN